MKREKKQAEEEEERQQLMKEIEKIKAKNDKEEKALT